MKKKFIFRLPKRSSASIKKGRVEKDSMGTIYVSEEAFWGAQTQRSLENFPIGDERMPIPLIRAFGVVKWAAAQTNKRLGKISSQHTESISQAALEVAHGDHDQHFPLVVWQTGSGTQTNMNVNEVIAYRANILNKGGEAIHPNDHVNCSQSSNDTFPTAMHIALRESLHHVLLPSLLNARALLTKCSKEWSKIVKIGRTHLQDATPLTLGQEFSGYSQQLSYAIDLLKEQDAYLANLAQGGTAVGTGINSDKRFPSIFCEFLSQHLGRKYCPHKNTFAALAAHDEIVAFSSILSTLAGSLFKIANDIRLLASGPRCGLGEISLPENEPGSSIMPGKVNPTQCEAMTMIALRVMGNHMATNMAGSQGQMELNVFKPLIYYNTHQSIMLLGEGLQSFHIRCLKGIKPNKEHITKLLNRSLMLVTALVPHIGYEKAAHIAHRAHQRGTSLRKECLALCDITPEEYDAVVDPIKMVSP